MKSYEIYDREKDLTIGILLYYEKDRIFIIELIGSLDEWSSPLLFSGLVKKKIYTVPRDISMMWVRERIIPSGRQNIGSILNTHHLKEYDELRFLELSRGVSSQDSLMIRSIDELPLFVKERMEHNLADVMPTGDSLLCFFNDDSISIIDLKELTEYEGVDKLLKNHSLLESAEIGAGGYYATFNDVIDIPANVLFKSGSRLPITGKVFLDFVRNNILDTTEACKILACTRQNLAYLVETDQLEPIKEARGNLYLKGDVLKNRQ